MDPNHILQLATLACIQDLIGAKKILVQLYCIMVDNNPDGGQSQDQWVMEDKLQRIRQQVNSKLDNQKKLALILSAVEENIDEQGNVRSPVTYVVSFLSLLDECITDDKIIDDSLATSTAYFLDLVFPFTPKLLLKSKFSQILTKLATPLTHPDADAPLVRSTIGAVETLLLAQDHQQWTSKGNVSPKRALIGLMELSFDPRPKVRKRAQESIHTVLSNPPPSPSPIHVAAPICADLSLQKLTSLLDTKKKDNNSSIIHILQLISSITSANSWPQSQIEPLCDSLLRISRTSDQYMVSSAFSAFVGLFESMSNDVDIEKFTNVLNVIFELKPAVNDTHLAAPWLAVIAKAIAAFSKLAPIMCLQKLHTVIPIVTSYLSSDSQDIYSSASQCLIAIITQAVPDDFILDPPAVSTTIYEAMDDFVAFLAKFTEKEVLSIKYQAATKEILEFLTAVVSKLRSRCNPDFLNVMEIVGQWRTNETEEFPFNKEAEDFISVCISELGPEVCLSILPLNLTGTGGPGRAWLLPLLRDNVRNADLEFYKRQILPLSEFFENKIKESTNKESVNVKIFQTIVEQIWSLLPHFCDLPKDLSTSFDDKFAAQLSDLLYARVELRTFICNGLRSLVESNVAYVGGALSDDKLMQQNFPVHLAEEYLKHLATRASNLLSVLFNVFLSISPDTRGFVLETIDMYLQIVPKDELENTFNKVCGLFKNALDEEEQENSKDSGSKLSLTMMDLIVAMTKYLPESSHNALFSVFATTVSIKDPLVQKRSYRIISKLSETNEGKSSLVNFIAHLEKVIVESTEITEPSARGARLAAILAILDLLPSSELHFIPSVLQEVIMSTKDNNERTRSISYQILISMGKKMSNGGVIDQSQIPGFEAEEAKQEASLGDFFTMVSAGLAAQTPHMISATITAISCLMFEFKDSLAIDVLKEISSTIELFLTHNSREIAKAAIGFVKVEVLSLPEDVVRENLTELLAKLMRWSHEHKGHFKSKVKHIVERLIRKFGADVVEAAIPEDDKKLVVNIRKSRTRAKRKQEDGGETTEKPKETKKFVSAYEEALYNSDVSDDEEIQEFDANGDSKKRTNQYILELGDTPLDLLDRQTMARISSSRPKKFTKKDMERRNVPSKNGKLVFGEGDDVEDTLANKGSGVDAYLDAVKQAPIRGQRNKLKFKNKRQNEDDWSDDEPEVKKKPTTNSRVSKPKKFKARKKL